MLPQKNDRAHVGSVTWQKRPINARHKARRFALQALYQWQITRAPVNDIEQEFFACNDIKKFDVDYFVDIVRGVVKFHGRIDTEMQPFLDRAIDELDFVELAALRIAIYELLYRTDVPYKVVINEALELTKVFGSSSGFKFVNGVLDKFVSLGLPSLG